MLLALYGAYVIGKLGILATDVSTNQALAPPVSFPCYKQFSSEFAFFTLLENRERIIGMRLGAAQQLQSGDSQKF